MKRKIGLLIVLISLFFLPFGVFAEEVKEVTNNEEIVDKSEAIVEEEPTTEEAILEDTTKPVEETIVAEEPTEENEPEVVAETPEETPVVQNEVEVPAALTNEVGSTSGPANVVDIGVLPPAIGAHPTYANNVSGLVILDQVWVNTSDNKIMTANDVFEANKHYTYDIKYRVIDGVHPDISVLMASEYSMGGGGTSGPDEGLAGCSFYMGEYQPGTSPEPSDEEFTINIAAPTLGGLTPQAVYSPKYSVYSQEWFNITDDVMMTSTSRFESNKEYKYTINLASAYMMGYPLFPGFEDSPYYLGFEGYVQRGMRSEPVAYFYFGNKDDLVIETGDIILENANLLEVGKNFELPNIDTKGLASAFPNWRTVIVDESGQVDEYVSVPLGTPINSGEKYYLDIGLNARAGYHFADDFEILIRDTNNIANIDAYVSEYEPSYSRTEILFIIPFEGHTFGLYSDHEGVVFTGEWIPIDIYPDALAGDGYVWASSDENVAVIHNVIDTDPETGEDIRQMYVEGVAPGTAVIIVNNVSGETATYTVEVANAPESVTIRESEVTIHTHESRTLEVDIVPASAKPGNLLHWDSDNYSVAYVDNDGTVHGNNPGTATITLRYAKDFDWEHPIVSTCTLTVLPSVDRVIVNKTTIVLNVGESEKIIARTEPDSDEFPISYYADDDIVAFVDSEGEVYGENEGETYIHVRAGFVEEIVRVIVKDDLTFKDVIPSDWFYEVVKYCYNNGIIRGYNDTTFGSGDKVTRGQLVTILWRLEGEPYQDTWKNNFQDVGEDYFTTAVKWANASDIIHGYNYYKFGPNDPIIRQDLAVILNNYAKFLGLEYQANADLSGFADYSYVRGGYAEPALKWASSKHIINGKNINGKKYIGFADNATRAETAAMLYNFINAFDIRKNQAISMAQDLLNDWAYSRHLLVKALVYNDFDREDAEYAASVLEAEGLVNWYDEAVRDVYEYLGNNNASAAVTLRYLVEQDEFTQDQAQYGVNNAVVDWNEQALTLGESLIEEMAFSLNGLKLVLVEYLEFLDSEATYAVTTIGPTSAYWCEQALRRVQELVASGPYYNDDSALTEELSLELFTDEEIEYALTNRNI